VVQCVAAAAAHMEVLLHFVAVCCSFCIVLLCVALCCLFSVLQCGAAAAAPIEVPGAVCCSVLQCGAVFCSEL